MVSCCFSFLVCKLYATAQLTVLILDKFLCLSLVSVPVNQMILRIKQTTFIKSLLLGLFLQF